MRASTSGGLGVRRERNGPSASIVSAENYPSRINFDFPPRVFCWFMLAWRMHRSSTNLPLVRNKRQAARGCRVGEAFALSGGAPAVACNHM